LAVAALIAGLASPLALAHPFLWLVPGAGVLVSGMALRQIARSEGLLLGRKAALAGLALSLVFGTAAPVRLTSDTWYLTEAARPMADQWFALLRDGKPERAYQFGLLPQVRRKADESTPDLWRYYRSDSGAAAALRKFVDEPLVRALLALGAKARVRLFETAWVEHGAEFERVCLIYAVTFEERDQRRTFFVNLILRRTVDPQSGQPQWRLEAYKGGVVPPSLQ
jgi:hypothetical protein